jgi:hypothetical protein
MGRGDNRLTKKKKQRRNQRKKKARAMKTRLAKVEAKKAKRK